MALNDLSQGFDENIIMLKARKMHTDAIDRRRMNKTFGIYPASVSSL